MGKTNAKKGKGPDKGPPKKKDTVIKKKVKVVKERIREKWTMEHKMFVCRLKKEGKEQKEIKTLFKERFGVVPIHSTLATWYNDKNMAKYQFQSLTKVGPWVVS